jgi:predicted enzyme related to lactoylglutathione lyase
VCASQGTSSPRSPRRRRCAFDKASCVDDGPVTEQTLQIAGFNILECRDSDEAVVSGEWVFDRQPAGDAGVLVFIRVDDVDASLEKIVEAGGEIVLPRTHEGEGLAYATFRDPAGSVLGVFQEGG